MSRMGEGSEQMMGNQKYIQSPQRISRKREFYVLEDVEYSLLLVVWRYKFTSLRG